MDPITAITTALIAGAAAASKDAASSLVKDAYSALRRFLIDQHRLSAVTLLDSDPSSAHVRHEIAANLRERQAADDPTVLELTYTLQTALTSALSNSTGFPANTLPLDITSGDIVAHRDVIVERLRSAR
jgi:hypothetical protein